MKNSQLTSNKQSYSELLKDPRWQAKRKQILKRDKYTCQACGMSEVVLHVHHAIYDEGALPWEYSDEVLNTLCETCHQEEEDVKCFDKTRYEYFLRLGFLRSEVSLIGSHLSQQLEKSRNHREDIQKFIHYVKTWRANS